MDLVNGTGSVSNPRAATADSRARARRGLVIEEKEVSVRGRFFRLARVSAEYYEVVKDPEAFIKQLKAECPKADVVTFLQEINDQAPRYPYHMEPDVLAVVPVTTYEHWWKKTVNDKTRNMVRKGQKAGVELRTCEYNDEFVRGIMSIYNECPIRQGRKFKHYGKDFETIKRDHGTFLERSEFIGAFLNGEMIGFIKLVHGNGSSSLMQIISKIAFRDKAPTNALIAKAVEICATRGIPYLHYGIWATRGIGDFKKHHGFVPHNVPRYFVPLTAKGRLMLKLKLHHPLSERLPESLVDKLVAWRTKWNLRKLKPSKA
jgi:hypothetical protein